ncbi:hypothetical protein Tco_1439079 [Tanacetum coccineum]
MWGNGCRTLNRHILRITLRASGRRKRKKSVGCEAPPVIKGSLDANEDIGVVEVSSAIDDVFDIEVVVGGGEACGVGENELNKVISALKDGGGEFDGRLDEINLNLSEELADNGVSPIPTSLVAHESPRVRQLWERIGIGDAHGLMDNGRNHKFVQLNVREWMSDSQSVYSSYHLEGKVVEGGRGKKVLVAVAEGRRTTGVEDETAETDIQEKEQKESQKQTNPSTEWKGQSQKDIFIKQSKYALETIKKYGMETSEPIDTLMVERSKLDEDPQWIQVDPTRYRKYDFGYSKASRESERKSNSVNSLYFAHITATMEQGNNEEKHLDLQNPRDVGEDIDPKDDDDDDDDDDDELGELLGPPEILRADVSLPTMHLSPFRFALDLKSLTSRPTRPITPIELELALKSLPSSTPTTHSTSQYSTPTFSIQEGKQMEEEITKQVQVEYLIHALKEISQVLQSEYLPLPKDLSRRCRRRDKRKLANEIASDTQRIKRALAKLIISKQESERVDNIWSILQEVANLFEVSLGLGYPEFKDEKSIILTCIEEYGDYQWYVYVVSVFLLLIRSWPNGLDTDFISSVISIATKKRFLQEPAVVVILQLSEKVRIYQKSQENRQKRANTDTRTEECTRAGSKVKKSNLTMEGELIMEELPWTLLAYPRIS